MALAILALIAGLSFSSLSPWLTSARRADTEAQFWRSVPPTELTLQELAAGGIDLSDTLSVSSDHARFKTYAARLGASPVNVDLAIGHERNGDQLVLTAPDTRSVLLTGGPPLRFRQQTSALVLEGDVDGAWTPLAVAPLTTNAPFVCVFDLISRDCR
ncbi:MAG: hypothetical protein ABUS48_01330 [Pseudomonadota bacterium]